jgi:predicted flap endonuclease-1-like 5' DNA nuclease
MTTIETIESIGPAFATKLKEAGVASITALLTRGATAGERDVLAAAVGVSSKVMLGWVNRADLFRVKGIGEEYADLLEAAGVDTVVELARRDPEHLYQQLVAANTAKKRVRRLPGATQVAEWVRYAGRLDRIVNY